MDNSIDELKFGNMSQESLYWVKRNSYLEKHFADLTTFTFPSNSSDDTKRELDEIITRIETVKSNPALLAQYQAFDRKSFNFYFELIDDSSFIRDKEGYKELVKAIIVDAGPLIFKLKEFNQRPRPFQLAAIYKVKLFPFQSMSQDTSSYPSANVYFARIICQVLGNRVPELYGNMQMLFNDISASRTALGLNYQTDVDVAVLAADKVLEDHEFKVKYKL